MMIVLHNYCKMLTPIKYNEKTYSWDKAMAMFDNAMTLDNSIFISFFSYWGHYGVPVFFFLSGYGLAQKYGQSSNFNGLSFMKYEYKKLFRLMIFGFIFYLVEYLIWFNGQEIRIIDVGLNLLLINTLFYPYVNTIVGPYWFICSTLELYLIFALFFNKRIVWGWFLMAITIILQILSGLYHEGLLLYINNNCAIGIVAFTLGCFLGKNIIIRLHQKYLILFFILSLILIVLSQISLYSWVLTPAFVVCNSVCFIKMLSEGIVRFLGLLGTFSPFLFISHPVSRYVCKVFFMDLNPFLSILIYILLSILLMFIIRFIVLRLPKVKL